MNDGEVIATVNGVTIGRARVLGDDDGCATNDDDRNMDCSWEMHLEPQPPSVNVQIVLTEVPGSGDQPDDDTGRIILNDIAFGDVYLCSGQSNMEMSVGDAFEAEEEIDASIHYPHLRLATVERTIAYWARDDVRSKGPQAWWRSGPDAVAGGSFGYFSAACYFTGRDVYTALQGLIPIGLVVSVSGCIAEFIALSPSRVSYPSLDGRLSSRGVVNRSKHLVHHRL